MKEIIILLLCSISQSIYGQSDTLRYDNGKIKTIKNHSKNLMTEYFESGKIFKEGFIILNTRDLGNPRQKEWYETGQLKFEILPSDSLNGFFENYYYQNSKLEKQEFNKITIIDGDTLPEFCYGKNWCENGTMTSADIWLCSNEVQDYVLHYCNGNIKIKTQWCRGSLIGKFAKYYENGKLYCEGDLEPCSPKKDIGNSSSIMIGTWNYYDDKGALIKTELGNSKELQID